MLRRTKAEQVEPVYDEFIKQFPDIKSLSRARITSIKKYNKRLGMHWRAKNFLDAAKYILKQYNGVIPKEKEKLLKIPGVGDYVAGAIQAVCFNNADYVIDSNIARYINRYYGLGLKGEIRRKKVVIEYVRKLFRTKNQREYLFYILDFTSLICKPISPNCRQCNKKKRCKYYSEIVI